MNQKSLDKPNTNNSGLINNQPTNSGLKKKTKELDNIVKTSFTLRGNRIGFDNGEIVKIKTRENWRETFYKEFGYLETPIDFYTNSAYANPKMKGIEHLDKLADFIQSLLTQQRTELNREWNSKLLLSQREMINSFKNKVIEELLKDVKKHQDTADSVEMLEFWKQVSYWLKLKQIEI